MKSQMRVNAMFDLLGISRQIEFRYNRAGFGQERTWEYTNRRDRILNYAF